VRGPAPSLPGFDLAGSVYTTGGIGLSGALFGGMLFGLGMALVGTCSFGLIVRAGTGDLRAMVSAFVVGAAAFAATGGVLSQVRSFLNNMLVVAPDGGPLIPGLASALLGLPASPLLATAPIAIALAVALPILADSRMKRRPRLLLAAIMLGLSIVLGWAATNYAVSELETTRLESLSFVAPVGRLLLQLMSDGVSDAVFGVASVLGVLSGSFLVATARGDTRWEAFDDEREMRRHLLGAVLMGCGGVLARGCTIGQGLSAASILAASAPLVLIGVLIGARIGLAVLIDGATLAGIRRTVHLEPRDGK
jgi:uncharacterized membrane protein YedE/YeeE